MSKMKGCERWLKTKYSLACLIRKIRKGKAYKRVKECRKACQRKMECLTIFKNKYRKETISLKNA